MKTWTFDLVADRPTTPEEESSFDWCDELANGDIGYATGGGLPTLFHCDIEAETLDEAVTEATRLILKTLPGLGLALDSGREPTSLEV
jgi:hypothetical protein